MAVARPNPGFQYPAKRVEGASNYNFATSAFGGEEAPGVSVFRRGEDGAVYHTYSTFARGLDGLWGMYQWLDRAPKGRNETGPWFRRHDEYGKR